MNEKLTQVDTKEIEIADTLFVRDIETRVFQTIALQTLSEIRGIAMLEGNIIDSFLGRDGPDRIKGISVDQDSKKQSVKLKIEVNVEYGLPLPDKAEEIQTKISREISRLTGLHVSSIHVVFKNLIIPGTQVEEIEEPSLLEIKEVTEAIDAGEVLS